MTINQEVLSKIDLAQYLFQEFGDKIAQAPGFRGLLYDYKAGIRQSRQVMDELALPAICTDCAVNAPGGGCCGPFVAGWYDPITLLLNLFFDVKFPAEPFYPNSCLFLGEHGCLLSARHHFCVNYLCGRITETVSSEELSRLTAQSGRELFLAWQLEAMIRDLLCSKGMAADELI